MIAGDLEYPSTYAALDVRFTDGTYLSDLGADDQHGVAASPSGQGKGKILYANQWNAVSLDVGTVAAGKTIDRVLVGYDNVGGATKDTRFGGWVDDIAVQADPAVIDGSDLTNYVDVRRGTNASGGFSRGNNLPISAVPNGFTFFTPVTSANSQSWEYYYQSQNNAANLPVLQGLAVSHEPSPWMGDRNQMSVMPSVATGTPTGSASGRGLAFDHATEVAHPDYYKVALAGGLTAETAPADHGGVYRFTFPASASKGSLVVDTIDDNGTFTVDAATGTMTGWVDNGSGLSAGRSRMFVYGTFDRPATAVGTAPGGHTGTRYASFDTSTSKQVTLKAVDVVHLARPGEEEPRPRARDARLRCSASRGQDGLERTPRRRQRQGRQRHRADDALLQPLPAQPLPQQPVREHRYGCGPALPVREPRHGQERFGHGDDDERRRQGRQDLRQQRLLGHLPHRVAGLQPALPGGRRRDRRRLRAAVPRRWLGRAVEARRATPTS